MAEDSRKGGDWISGHQFDGLKESMGWEQSEAAFDAALVRLAEARGIDEEYIKDLRPKAHGVGRNKVPA